MRVNNFVKRLLCLAPFAGYTAALAEALFPLLLDARLDELRAGLDNGLFTSVDLVNAYTARINEVNGALHAVTEINPDALKIAAALDLERETQTQTVPGDDSRGPLHGIPVLVKDNIGTADKLNNTAGSYALLGARLKQDSTVVTKLRRAGAIILGKANLSEFASMRSVNQSSGWSAYGGQAFGAYLPGQDPSGSSSGSGVASSLGLAWASLGTETAGSICQPANSNNVVGIKPTVGLTSRFGVVPITEHQDTVGPLARTVKDAAFLLQAIAGVDQRDNYTLASPFGNDVPDYVAACKETGLRGKRLGVPKGFKDWIPYPPAQPALDAFDGLLDVLRDGGAEVILDIEMPGMDKLMELLQGSVVPGADFMTDMPRYLDLLATNPNNITSVQELRDYVHNDPREMADTYDTELWDRVLERGLNNTTPEFWDHYRERMYYGGPQAMTGALRNHTLDALVTPPLYLSILSAVAGAPVISVPAGRAPDDTPLARNDVDTLNTPGPNFPFGLAFGGDLFREETLIEIAYAFEQATSVREKVVPYIQPKTELRDVVEDVGEL